MKWRANEENMARLRRGREERAEKKGEGERREEREREEEREG